MALNTHSLDIEQGSAQYATITDAAQTGLDITGDLTIEYWIKPESTTNNANVVNKCNASGNAGYVIQFAISGKTYVQIDQSTNGTDLSTATTTATISTGAWTHVAMVYTASTGAILVYFNGVSQAFDNSTTNATAINNNVEDFRVGANIDPTPGNKYDGLVDEVRIWNSARTAQQISDNYQKQIGTDSNLKAYYRFNNAYTDFSGNGNTLTASGSPVFSTDVPFVGTGDSGFFAFI